MSLKKVLMSIFGAFAVTVGAIFGFRKKKEVKQLKKAIDKSKKVEKAVTSNIKELEKDKKKNKKEISNLKRKLTISQKNTKGMEKAFGGNDADKAAEYLKQFMD